MLFGVAPGWNEEPLRNDGTEPRTRGTLLDEQIQALKVIWTCDEAEFHGKFIDFDPIWTWPKPVQDPHPPVYVGGWGPAAARRVRQHGEGWLHGAVTDAESVRAQFAMRAEHAPDCAISIFGADGNDHAVLDTYREHAAERVAIMLEPTSERDTLMQLDALAPLVARYA